MGLAGPRHTTQRRGVVQLGITCTGTRGAVHAKRPCRRDA